ncbi:MAG: response regulator, partial [Spirochaetes bacterium]|nr:response regulator [Spirochaetota bacterium]
MRKKAKKPLLLLVDDSPGFIRLACRRLGEICQIITAESGKDAVMLLNQTHLLPDLIICDLDMPEMNGYQLLEYLKKTRLYKNIPFIILTENEGYKTQCL